MSATIKYNGSTIASVEDGKSVILDTLGKLMSGNVTVEAAGGGGGGTIEGIPSYLQHMALTPATNLRSVQIPIGTSARMLLISSVFSFATPSVTTVFAGAVYRAKSNDRISTYSRVYCMTTSGGDTYYGPSSSGGANWSYADGVLTIANSSGWIFAAGVTYDFFWF
jgi:hypothetical protein